MRVDDVFNFVQERYRIMEKKDAGLPKPWTADSILRDFRFCCVHREDDKVTQWIATNWREPHRDDPYLWFALAVARYFNWPDTLEAIGYPVPFKAEKVARILQKRADRKIQNFTGVYFINSIGPKIDSVVFDRLQRLWDQRKPVNEQLRYATTLAQMYEIFAAQYGFGSFMVGQVIADYKYALGAQRGYADWHTWAVSGPGSKRGMARVLGRELTRTTVNYARRPENRTRALKLPEREWLEKLTILREALNIKLLDAGIPPLHAQDVQGVLCEFDKYERVRLNEGRPRNKYPGKGE